MSKHCCSGIIAVLCAVLMSSCAPRTPQDRIREHPVEFAALDPKHRELVEQGLVVTGMPVDAVVFAWGEPSEVFVGGQGEDLRERWDYTTTRVVHVSPAMANFQSYPHGDGGAYRCSGNPSPEIAYVPSRAASVWFTNGLVDAWERQR